MKKIIIILAVTLFTILLMQRSCPMLAGQVQSKIEQAKKLHDEGMRAHSSGDHAKSEEILKKL